MTDETAGSGGNGNPMTQGPEHIDPAGDTGLPDSTDMIPSGSGLPTIDARERAVVVTPVEAMVGRYRVLRFVSLSLTEIPLLSSPEDRALAYIQIGKVMLTKGTAQLGLVLARAQQEAEGFRRNLKYVAPSQTDLSQPPLEVTAAQDVTQVLFGIAQLALQSSSRNTPSIMEGLYNHISSYDASLEDGNVIERLREYQTGGVDFTRRTSARIQDLTSLAILAHSFNYDENFVQRIIDQINKTRENPNVIKAIPREEYLKILNCCLRLNVEMGDLVEARHILYFIEKIPSRYTSSGHPAVSEQVPVEKIVGLTNMAIAESRSFPVDAESSMPSQDEILTILRSGHTEAIKALGYLQLVTEEDLVSLELPDIDQVLEALQEGMDERMLSIRQIANERLIESDARRRLASKETVKSINPLAELDSFFQELEQRIPPEHGYAERFYILRLILRNWHDGLKDFIAKEGQRIQSLGIPVTGRSQLIKQVLGSLPFNAEIHGYAPLIGLSFYGDPSSGYETGKSLPIVRTVAAQLVFEKTGQQPSPDMNIWGGIRVEDYPIGINFRIGQHFVGGADSYTALSIGFSQKALEIIAEATPLPMVQWTGDPNKKHTLEKIKDERKGDPGFQLQPIDEKYIES